MIEHIINSSHKWFLAMHKIDEISKEPFKIGDKIVICSNCNKVFLVASWNMLGGKCIQCKQANTKTCFSSEDFQQKKIYIGSSNLIKESRRSKELKMRSSSLINNYNRNENYDIENDLSRQIAINHENTKSKKVIRKVFIYLLVIFVMLAIIWPNWNSVTETNNEKSGYAYQTTAYAYVASNGLNVRSGPSMNYRIVTILYKGNCVQILKGSENTSYNWQKIRYNHYEGWVNSSYLFSLTVTKVMVGNYLGNQWITQPGQKLYAKDIRYLMPTIIYNASLSEEVTFYVKIINQYGTIERNTSSSPIGYSYLCARSIKSGENNYLSLSGLGSTEGGSYSKGIYTIEVWYRDMCLCSEKVRLY